MAIAHEQIIIRNFQLDIPDITYAHMFWFVILDSSCAADSPVICYRAQSSHLTTSEQAGQCLLMS